LFIINSVNGVDIGICSYTLKPRGRRCPYDLWLIMPVPLLTDATARGTAMKPAVQGVTGWEGVMLLSIHSTKSNRMDVMCWLVLV